jgi:hypothetical protein
MNPKARSLDLPHANSDEPVTGSRVDAAPSSAAIPRRLAAPTLLGPGVATEALPHRPSIVRDGDQGKNRDPGENDHLGLLRVRVGQDLAGNGIIRMLSKCHRAFRRDPGNGEAAALCRLPAERGQPPIGFYARGHTDRQPPAPHP